MTGPDAISGSQVGVNHVSVHSTTLDESYHDCLARLEYRVSDWGPVRGRAVRVVARNDGRGRSLTRRGEMAYPRLVGRAIDDKALVAA